MSGTVDNLHLNDVPTSAWMVPAEKARAVSFLLTMPSAYNIDLSKAYERGLFTTFQTLYVDNGKNPQPLSIYFPQTQQTITAAPYSQGYYAVQSAIASYFTVTTTGSAHVGVIAINVPVPGHVWSTDANGVPPLNYTESTSRSVGTTSAALIAQGEFTNSLTITNTSSAGNIWLNPTGGTAAVNSGLYIPPGSSFVFGSVSNPMPVAAITAITDAGAAVNAAICGG